MSPADLIREWSEAVQAADALAREMRARMGHVCPELATPQEWRVWTEACERERDARAALHAYAATAEREAA